MHHLIQELSVHLGAILACLTTLAGIIGFWKPAKRCGAGIWKWFARGAKLELILVEHIERTKHLDNRRDIRADEINGMVQKIHKAVFNGGKDGMIHHMDILKAQAEATFETSAIPMFVCDSHGVNMRVNLAYRQLVEVRHDDDISGTQWMNVIYGDLRDTYIAEFSRCATNNEDFFGDVDFHNPATNAHRGRWKIHAPASRKTEGGSIYVGTFIGALDNAAQELAEKHRWQVCRL